MFAGGDGYNMLLELDYKTLGKFSIDYKYPVQKDHHSKVISISP